MIEKTHDVDAKIQTNIHLKIYRDIDGRFKDDITHGKLEELVENDIHENIQQQVNWGLELGK